MTEGKAARHSSNYSRAKAHASGQREKIIADYERGALVAGLVIAVSFGLMMVHWAVVS